MDLSLLKTRLETGRIPAGIYSEPGIPQLERDRLFAGFIRPFGLGKSRACSTTHGGPIHLFERGELVRATVCFIAWGCPSSTTLFAPRYRPTRVHDR
jgi:hypothetical protein